MPWELLGPHSPHDPIRRRRAIRSVPEVAGWTVAAAMAHHRGMHIFGKRVDWLETGLDLVGVIFVLFGLAFLVGGVGLARGNGRLVMLALALIFVLIGVSMLKERVIPALRKKFRGGSSSASS